jgi:DNA modification methylase
MWSFLFGGKTMERIIHGDCLEELKLIEDNSIDSIVTDPPYCSGGYTEAQKRSAKTQGTRTRARTYKRLGWFANDNMGTIGLVFLMRSLAIEFQRVLKDGGSALIFCDWRMYPHLAPVLESTGLRLTNLIVWDKGSPGMGNGFRPQHELIMQFTKGKPNYYSLKGRNVLSVKRVAPQKRHHPTEKPIELMEQLIKVVTPPGGTVLDPFCGSGPTLIAAKREGFSFIGIDREKKFVEVAKERVGS